MISTRPCFFRRRCPHEVARIATDSPGLFFHTAKILVQRFLSLKKPREGLCFMPVPKPSGLPQNQATFWFARLSAGSAPHRPRGLRMAERGRDWISVRVAHFSQFSLLFLCPKQFLLRILFKSCSCTQQDMKPDIFQQQEFLKEVSRFTLQ